MSSKRDSVSQRLKSLVDEEKRRKKAERIFSDFPVGMSRKAKAIMQFDNIEHRWMAGIIYKNGARETVTFEELEELHDIVEHGLDWNTIERILVTPFEPSTLPARRANSALKPRFKGGAPERRRFIRLARTA